MRQVLASLFCSVRIDNAADWSWVSWQATCKFFRQPANFAPDTELSMSELAALDMCQERTIFKPMSFEEREVLKQRCGGSWKLVLRFLLAGEYCSRREKSQVLAGPGHSVAVTSKGEVYTFGSNSLGQLGHGTLVEEWKPRPVRCLSIIHVASYTQCRLKPTKTQ